MEKSVVVFKDGKGDGVAVFVLKCHGNLFTRSERGGRESRCKMFTKFVIDGVLHGRSNLELELLPFVGLVNGAFGGSKCRGFNPQGPPTQLGIRTFSLNPAMLSKNGSPAMVQVYRFTRLPVVWR